MSDVRQPPAAQPAAVRPHPVSRLVHEVLQRVHLRAMRALEITPADRDVTVHDMLTTGRRDAVEYWTFLMLSMGIATLGLATGSTAVVIGAMLVSPLMGPIVHLAMGLVVGSPVLTIRSLVRVLGSVAAVSGGAALLTMALPFHEVTSEIAARTQPTALDLFLAVFVALAAAITAVRSKSAQSSVAAGAAIGIALVPPICVIGYGVGIADAGVAGGALLLFVTNLTSIVFVGVLFFWMLGFDAVTTAVWDAEALATARHGSFTRAVLTAADRVFGSRHSRLFRVLVPLALVASVAVPLSRALDQVAWEIRARGAVSRILDAIPRDAGSLVQSLVDVKGGGVSARLYLVGDPGEAAALEKGLASQIAAATGVVPDLRVVAMPDVGAVRQAMSVRERPAAAPSPVRDPAAEVAGFRREVETALRGAWPEGAFGKIAAWSVELGDSSRAQVRVRHWGAPAGAGADSLLASAMAGRVPVALSVRSEGLGGHEASAEAADGAEWLPRLVRTVDRARTLPGAFVCVEVPSERTLRRSAAGRAIAAVARAEAEGLGEGRASVTAAGSRWKVALSPTACAGEGAGAAGPAAG